MSILKKLHVQITPYYISPSQAIPSSYSAKRTGEVFYRLYGQVTYNANEYAPASLDLLSIEWDYTIMIGNFY